MPRYKVYVTDTRHQDYEIERTMLAAADCELITCQCETEDDIIRECADADALLVDLAPATARVVSSLPHCRVINRYGVGYENVDIEECTKQGIQVTYVPDYCMDDVSEHVLALMFSCLRHTALRDHHIRQGEWNIHQPSFRLGGKTLGLLGFGKIARSLAHKCSGFGFKDILAYDPYLSAEEISANGAKKAELRELLTQSDIVSLHLPVTEETRHIMNEDTLSYMKPTAIFINTARGVMVDDAALIRALKNNKLMAAGLDTHNIEPLPKDSPFFAMDNVVLTDHTAYSTIEGEKDLKRKSAQNIIDVLYGRAPKYPVNKLT